MLSDITGGQDNITLPPPFACCKSMVKLLLVHPVNMLLSFRLDC